MDAAQRSFDKKVQSFKFLTREKESSLFETMHGSDAKASARARELILNSYLKLCKSHAHRRLATPLCRDMQFDDLFQEAVAALCVAIDKFDITMNVRFSTYAHFWIRNGLDDYVTRSRSILKIGSTHTTKKVMAFYSRSKNKIKSKNPDIDYDTLWSLMAEDLNVSVGVVRAVGGINEQYTLSLDQAPNSNSEGDTTILEIIPDSDDTTIEDLERQMDLEPLIEKLREYSLTLKDRERFIFENRTLKEGEEKWNLQQLGDKFDISRERVRQLENKIINNLERHLSNKLKKIVASL